MTVRKIHVAASGEYPSAPAGRTLSADLRAAIPDAIAALILSGVAFAVLAARVHAGVAAAAISMPNMIKDGGIWPYSVSQALGFSALAWSWLTILFGVSLPIWAARRQARLRKLVERLHRSTSLTVIALVIAHAVLLLWDRMGDTLLTVFVPYTSSYIPGRFPTALGMASFYPAMLLGLSFYFRKAIGARAWRLAHRWLIPIVYALAVAHTFLYGSDVKDHNTIWIVLWAMQAPVIVAFVTRLVAPAALTSARSRSRWSI